MAAKKLYANKAAKSAAFYARHRARIRQKRKLRYDGDEAHRSNVVRRAIAWGQANPDQAKRNKQRCLDRLKRETFAAYGDVCRCCGESQIEFLSIDHIYGDGHTERKGHELYRKLRRLGYPMDRYQLLCMNCNFAKGHFGACPHARMERVS